MAGRSGGPDGGGNVIVAGADIRRNGSQHVIGGVAAHPFFQHDVTGNLVHGHVSGPFDHGLAAHLAADLGQFAVDDHLGHLGPVVAVVDGPGTDTVAQ